MKRVTLYFSVVEITGKRRSITGVHTHSAISAGYALCSLVSYYLRNWRSFYFAVSLSPIPFFVIYFFVSLLNFTRDQQSFGFQILLNVIKSKR